MAATTETRTEKGISLARGPALILGTVLLAAGLYFLYKQHFFPKLSNFPNGHATVQSKVFGIFGANGWTGMLTAIAGGLLLFGAAQHLLAKTMSLIVGVALAAAAIIAATRSGNMLGLAAANGWTEVGWGVAAAILLLNTLIPRRRTTVVSGPGEMPARPRSRTAPPAAGAGAVAATEEDRLADRTTYRDGDADAEYEDAGDEMPTRRAERVLPPASPGEGVPVRSEGEPARAEADLPPTRTMGGVPTVGAEDAATSDRGAGGSSPGEGRRV